MLPCVWGGVVCVVVAGNLMVGSVNHQLSTTRIWIHLRKCLLVLCKWVMSEWPFYFRSLHCANCAIALS